MEGALQNSTEGRAGRGWVGPKLAWLHLHKCLPCWLAGRGQQSGTNSGHGTQAATRAASSVGRHCITPASLLRVESIGLCCDEVGGQRVGWITSVAPQQELGQATAANADRERAGGHLRNTAGHVGAARFEWGAGGWLTVVAVRGEICNRACVGPQFPPTLPSAAHVHQSRAVALLEVVLSM